MERERLAHLLRHSDLLGGLGPEDRLEIAALARTVRAAAGEALFFQSEAPDALYVIERGRVHIVLRAEGRDVLLNQLGPGAVFGEIALLDGAPRTADAIAATEALLVRIPRAPFLDLLERRPQLSRALIELLCARLRNATRRVEEGAALDARQRLVRYLLRLAAARGHETPEGTLLDEHLPQEVLATALGVSRQTVNKQLRALEVAGVVEIRRARVLIRDLGALEALRA